MKKTKLSLILIKDSIRYFDVCWQEGYEQLWSETYEDIIQDLKNFIKSNDIQRKKINNIFAAYVRDGGSDDLYELTEKELDCLFE